MTSESVVRNRLRVYYSLTGADLLPEDVTRATGISPSQIWHRGEIRHAATGKLHEESGWSIESRLDESESMADHLIDLLALLSTASNTLTSYAEKFRAHVSVVIYAHEWVPEMFLS